MNYRMFKYSFISISAKFIHVNKLCIYYDASWHLEGLIVRNAFGYDMRKVDGYGKNEIYEE